jgi:hypothetical protein
MRRFALLAVLGWVSMTTGCAAKQDPRTNLLEGTSSHAVYKLPPESLLATMRTLLVEQGYELLPTSDPLYVKTTWKIDGNLDMGARWSRVLVQAVQLENGRTMVRAYRMHYMTNGRASSHPGSFAGQKESKDAGSEGGGSSGGGGGGQVGRYVLGEPLSPTKPHVVRATDIEWALLGRVSPRMAGFLEQRVDAYLQERQQPPAPPRELLDEPLPGDIRESFAKPS